MFEDMIRDWFSWSDNYSDFIKALLLGDLKAMNTYMNKMTLEMFSYFDTGKTPQGETELAETVSRALQQIEEKNYQASLIAKGVPQSRIRKYGFGFCGKKVLIGKP